MGLQAEMGEGEPAPRRFGIDAQKPTGVGQRNEGHRATPFRVARKKDDHQADHLEGKVNGKEKGKVPVLWAAGSLAWSRAGTGAQRSSGREGEAARHPGLASFFATAAMVIAGPILMGASPAGPVT